MNNFSLIEKFNILMKLISSSSLFVMFSIIGILFLICLIVFIVLNKKIPKLIIISTIVLISAIILINYGTILLNIADIIIDQIFIMLYFPTLPVYISILLISNITFIISMFIRKTKKVVKIINSINFILLNFFFILIINLVNKYNLNIYEEINLFTNSTLLVLLELSTGLFVSWILVHLLISAHDKLKKYDKIKCNIMPEIIFD